jgi:hypothetical protein
MLFIRFWMFANEEGIVLLLLLCFGKSLISNVQNLSIIYYEWEWLNNYWEDEWRKRNMERKLMDYLDREKKNQNT